MQLSESAFQNRKREMQSKHVKSWGRWQRVKEVVFLTSFSPSDLLLRLLRTWPSPPSNFAQISWQTFFFLASSHKHFVAHSQKWPKVASFKRLLFHLIIFLLFSRFCQWKMRKFSFLNIFETCLKSQYRSCKTYLGLKFILNFTLVACCKQML